MPSSIRDWRAQTIQPCDSWLFRLVGTPPILDQGPVEAGNSACDDGSCHASDHRQWPSADDDADVRVALTRLISSADFAKRLSRRAPDSCLTPFWSRGRSPSLLQSATTSCRCTTNTLGSSGFDTLMEVWCSSAPRGRGRPRSLCSGRRPQPRPRQTQPGHRGRRALAGSVCTVATRFPLIQSRNRSDRAAQTSGALSSSPGDGIET